jgi:hypothetical protein
VRLGLLADADDQRAVEVFELEDVCALPVAASHHIAEGVGRRAVAALNVVVTGGTCV